MLSLQQAYENIVFFWFGLVRPLVFPYVARKRVIGSLGLGLRSLLGSVFYEKSNSSR